MTTPVGEPTLPPPDAPAPAGASVPDSDRQVQLPAPPRGPRDPNGPPSHRDDIVIPDYTLVKRIGSGAYGEVWLARSVTGAYRAVKIVWREDFELTRTFHREFLGIQQFEPISRGHPCLVHILHVGWNEDRGFYYCVMELADDAEEGPNFENVSSYIPRTLGTDMKRHGRLDLTFCRDAGVYMADALHYMHNRGLTHRDIKPSNIIFCGGVCKLADIGLVAGFGERTYVGTEGFVPPEGPGTAQADIYSLGKVLYEMSSGKDRMEFPEVPAQLSDEEWPFWLDLNRVICKACAPDLKERFQTAAEFAEALQHVGEQRPESLPRRLARAAVLTLAGSAIAAAALVSARYQQAWDYAMPLPVKPAPLLPQPPQKGKLWQNRLGQWFTFSKDVHVADLPVDASLFRSFLESSQRAGELEVVPTTLSGRTIFPVIFPAPEADALCEWLTRLERQTGRLGIDHEYAWRPYPLKRPAGSPPLRPGWQAVRLEIRPVAYGVVRIISQPGGAGVYEGEMLLGRTPLTLGRVRASRFDYEVRLPGYRPEPASGNLTEGQTLSFNLRLRATGAVVFGKPWENSLGIRFVPLGRAMIAATEMRRGDYARFAQSLHLPPPDTRPWAADPDLPVTHVNRADAVLFCRWLTDQERAKGLLEPEQEYRLPSDDEWSMAAYLPLEIGDTPAERSMRIEGIYPWGFTWPPAPTPGNFADKAADPTGKAAIANYSDNFATLAPVGRFRTNSRGIFDLAGNVWEWVSDSWSGAPAEGVIRGGAHTTYKREELLASYRKPVPAAARAPDIGFRILLGVVGQTAREED